MKAVMNVVITKPGGGCETVQSTVDLPFAPYPGMEIECSVWKSSRPVQGTLLSLEPDSGEFCLYVHLGRDETRDAEEQRRLIDSYKGHGWKQLC
jgi:hypothetical protein